MESNCPSAPESLDGEALLEWMRICAELDSIGKLAKTDRAIITLYVQTWAIWSGAVKMVAEFGPIIQAFGQARPNPYLRVVKEFGPLMRGLCTDLGLTPASRGVEQKASDELEI